MYARVELAGDETEIHHFTLVGGRYAPTVVARGWEPATLVMPFDVTLVARLSPGRPPPR